MRIGLRLALLLAIVLPHAGYCGELAVVQSRNLPPFDLVRTSFAEALGRSIPVRAAKTISPVTIDEYVISAFQSPEELLSKIAAGRPRAVFAIGPAALELSQRLKEVPVVYALVPSPKIEAGRAWQVTGVGLETPPEEWFDATTKVLPGRTRIGVVTKRARGDGWLGRAEALASARGFVITTRFAEGATLHAALESLGGGVDALWHLPGPGAAEAEAVESLLTFAMEKRLPVISFQERHLRLGAAAAIAPDLAAMGAQAAELAVQAVGAGHSALPPVNPPRSYNLTINARVFERLGLKIIPGVPDYLEGLR